MPSKACDHRPAVEVSATSDLRRPNEATRLEGDGSQAEDGRREAETGVGIGDRLGRYELLRVLGQGGMGRVFEARDPELDRPVAIKVLFGRHATKDVTAGAQRLRREAKALAALSHPNVVQVYDVGSTDGHVWIAMELVEGSTLAHWIETPRSLQQYLSVFADAARGLSAAHEAGLVHRDFKLTNVIVDPSGRARVLDFGLTTAFLTADDLPPTRSGSVDPDPELFTAGFGQRVGTPLYMSPEQFHGEVTDARSDQFALCVSLYVTLHGRYPMEVLDQSPRSMSIRIPDRPDVPKSIDRVLDRGMAPSPDDRYASIEDLVAALRRASAPWYARRATRVGAGLVLVGGLAWLAWPEAQTACTTAKQSMEEIWSEERASQLEPMLVEGTRSRQAWDLARTRLDEYAADWVSTRTRACQAGRDDSSALDQHMACLDRRLAALEGTLEATAHDGASADAALTGALGLSSPQSCLDTAALAERPIPDDPTVAARVELARRGLARVGGKLDAGAYESALEGAEALLREAETIGYGPLTAEVLTVMAEATNGQLDVERTRSLLERAYHEASSSGHETKALDAATALIWVVGVMGRAPDDATPWVRQAEALLERLDRPSRKAAELDKNLGLLAYARGDYAAAIASLERSVNTMVAEGQQGPTLGNLYNNLGVNRQLQGQLAEAKAAYERALELYGDSLGETHPMLGRILANLGVVQRRLGDPEASRASLERAVTITSEAMGFENVALYAPLVNLGNLDVIEGKPRDAIPKIQRALAILEETRGPDDPTLSDALDSLGVALAAAGQHEEAALQFARAARLLENGGGNPQGLAHAVMGHGTALRMVGRRDEARARLREAVTLLESSEGDPGLLGEAKQNLALALDDEARARTVMLEAQASFREAEDRTADLAAAQQWLDEHPAPTQPDEPAPPK